METRLANKFLNVQQKKVIASTDHVIGHLDLLAHCLKFYFNCEMPESLIKMILHHHLRISHPIRHLNARSRCISSTRSEMQVIYYLGKKTCVPCCSNFHFYYWYFALDGKRANEEWKLLFHSSSFFWAHQKIFVCFSLRFWNVWTLYYSCQTSNRWRHFIKKQSFVYLSFTQRRFSKASTLKPILKVCFQVPKMDKMHKFSVFSWKWCRGNTPLIINVLYFDQFLRKQNLFCHFQCWGMLLLKVMHVKKYFLCNIFFFFVK